MKKPDFERLKQLGWDYRSSKTFLVANGLDIFSEVGGAFLSARELARKLGLNERALSILLNALTAMGLLVKEGERYGNSDLAAAFLVKGGKDYRGEIFKHVHQCWNMWTDLELVLREGRPRNEGKADLREDREAVRHFIWGMDNFAKDKAALLAGSLDLRGVRAMLDLGGGAATYSIAFAEANRGLRAVVLDLPLALEVARENIDRHCLNKRVLTREGSFWDIELGSGYDLVWVSQIIHMLNEEQNAQLMKKAAAALAPGGCLMVHDFVLRDDFVSPYESALFAVHMLVATREGRTYSVSEIGGWLKEAGLGEVSYREIDEHSALVMGVSERKADHGNQ